MREGSYKSEVFAPAIVSVDCNLVGVVGRIATSIFVAFSTFSKHPLKKQQINKLVAHNYRICQMEGGRTLTLAMKGKSKAALLAG